MDSNYYNNMDYHTPQNARYYQNNGSFNNQRGNVGDPYSKNGYDNNLYSRNPQYENRGPQYINYPPVNYNNNYDGGGVYSDLKNGYSNNDNYSNIKSTSPNGSAYGDSGYSNPYNNTSSHSNVRYKKNPYATPFDDTKTSYNSPYVPSPVKNPSSPVIPGMNPTYPPINPIPTRQVPYDGRPADTYSEGASPKGMYSYSTSQNTGPTNHGQEKTLSPTSVYSSKPFLEYDDDDEKRPKPGGLTRYCCGGRVTCCKACAIICCILVLLIIGIVAAVLLWARPPKVDFLGIVPSPNGLPAYANTDNGFDFNFGLEIQVDNPNIVGANFEMIQAVAFYPGHPDPIGGGNLTDVTIAAKGNTTIDFPFSVNYNENIDPGFSIALDIFQKCGLIGGGQPQKLEIDYKLTLTIKVLLITISPSFNKSAMIDCPIKSGQIPNIPGFDISKAAKAFGGIKKKRDSLTEIPRSNLFNR